MLEHAPSEVPGGDDTGLSDIMTSHNPSLNTRSPIHGDLGRSVNEDTPQITKMEPSGDIADLTSAKLPLPHQVEETNGVDEHRIHHDPLEGGTVDHDHHDPLNDRSSPTRSSSTGFTLSLLLPVPFT